MKEAIDIISLNTYKRETLPEFVFFNVAESNEKLCVPMRSILLVETDEHDSRNKVVCIFNEQREYTLMNVPFSKLLGCSPNLIQVSKKTLLSIEAVRSSVFDCITLKNIFTGWNNKQITLNKNYRKNFHAKIGK